ncbi:hypothetical protein V6N11_058403 [Hibiscus sabdariffa]|uniref:Integrase catalytic domain-containing protein n=1 Tax=Hibiscus sabdariffa TaxID=183260 RepID=A0ABR2U463_9ROSI
MTKAPFSGKGERASDLLGLIHSDVCGPMNTQARGGFQYLITFTDDFSRYGYIYLMHHKSKALERFKEFKNEVQNQHGKSIKALRPDRGGEYLSQDFDELLKECGIVSQLTPPGTPQWNGVFERRNRTLLDMVRSMMSHSDLLISFCGHALETAAFTLNRVPSKSVQKTPYEIWTGKRPSMSFMKIWGCQAYVKYQMSTKLEPRSHKCIFVGYPKESKGYYFFNPKENKMVVARTGVFLEKEFLSSKRDRRNIKLEEVQQQQVTEPEVEQTSQIVEENSTNLETQPLRRSTRERHEPERYGFLVTSHGDVIHVDQDEPKTYQEAVSSPDSEKWLEAMRSEMDSMSNNQTYKGSVVAKSFRQIHGIDYDETFSPVAMLKSIRILLAIAAFHDYEIWQMDVKTAFLNGKLEEDVYMTQPEGFVTPENAGKEMCPSSPQERERMSQIPYASAIGSLMYTMICTRQDLSYALSMTSRYQENQGFVFCLNGGAVSWKSSKQDTVADSTTEVEYIAASEAAKEAIWIKKFVTELGVVPSISDAMELYCDNNGAIVQVNEPRSHQRSKHILRCIHLIREIIDRGDVEICKVHTDDNIVDWS